MQGIGVSSSAVNRARRRESEEGAPPAQRQRMGSAVPMASSLSQQPAVSVAAFVLAKTPLTAFVSLTKALPCSETCANEVAAKIVATANK